jgi:hypothetical protein
VLAHLRDTLLVLPPEQNGPSNSSRVLALEEERFGLAILESEDLAVAADVQLTLKVKSATVPLRPLSRGR